MSDDKRKSRSIIGIITALVIFFIASVCVIDSQVAGTNYAIFQNQQVMFLIGIICLVFLSWAYLLQQNAAKTAQQTIEDRFRTAADSAQVGIYLSDSKGKCLYANPCWCKMAGLSQEQAMGDGWLNGIHIEDRANLLSAWQKMVDSAGSWELDYRFQTPTGKVIWVHGLVTAMHATDGNISGYIGINTDITERKLAEASLSTTSELLERTGQMAQVGGWELDLRSMKLFWSLQTCRIHDLDQLMTPTLEQAINFYTPEARPIIHAAVQAGIDHGMPWDLELPLITSKGREILVRAQGSAIKENDRVVKLLGVFQDITERKQVEEDRLKMEVKLQQAHKLESIGLLAGGIAHDFNNILTGLFGYIEIARLHAERGNISMIESSLNVATNSLGRAKDLTRQLLTFSKGGAPQRRQCDIKSLISAAATFALSGSAVQLKLNISEDLWSCRVDENQISQVIDNIVRNAKEAMPAGGSISIRAENISLPADLTKFLVAGHYSRVTIEDAGPGIPEKNLNHVFDPFFSTKEAGRGLGLSLAYSIIKRHDGIIEIDSKLGLGTRFIIYLPASLEATLPEINSEPAAVVHRKSRILVMDDDEAILNFAAEALRDRGYSVECARTGTATLELYKQATVKSLPFDLVILDLTIRGGMGGVETLRELLKIDPEVKAVVSSGYSDDPILVSPQAYGFKGVVPKPYKITDMVEVLDKVAPLQG